MTPPAARHAVSAACWVVLSCATPATAFTAAAQTPPGVMLVLTPSLNMQEQLPADLGGRVPVFVSGDQLTGQSDVNTVAQGRAELRRHDIVIKADRLEHVTATDRALATGSVRVLREGNLITGPRMELQLDTSEGFFDTPQYTFASGGTGTASRFDFEGNDRTVAHHVRYSTCGRTGDAWQPAWLMSARRMVFDQATDTGTATGAVLSFKGVPLLASPYVSFPLSDKRKSGLLSPTLNIDNISGVEVTLPYYLNLAPHYDATLYPTTMSKRGIDLGGEFRYLDRQFSGIYRGSYMPSDKLRDRDRWASSLKHSHRFTGPDALGPIGLRLDFNNVSDDNYWRDFPRTSTNLSERLMANDVVLSAGRGAWAYSAGAYTWKTLQPRDVDRIQEPFNRVPSVAVRYRPGTFNWGKTRGWDFQWMGEATHFQTARNKKNHDRPLRLVNPDVNGTRLLSVANISKTWRAPGWYVRPGLQLHMRHYALDRPVSAPQAGVPARTHQFAIPTTTFDAGLFFDRDASILGRTLTQTFEPRLFVADTPFHAQSFLPLYDTSNLDFNASTIFSAQPFGGHDRLADFRAVTVGATTRLIDEGGAELANLTVAQRVRLQDQRVTLNNLPIQDRLSDILVGGNIHWHPHWSLNSTVQYNPKTSEYQRVTVGTRYSPSNYRVINAAYRMQRNDNNPLVPKTSQIDVGWQWPLKDLLPGPGAQDRGNGQALGPDQWYSVGRLNYNIEGKEVVDAVLGIEYDAGCWIGRFVVESLKRGQETTNRRFLFQLEFSGFTRVGVNPLQTLRDNIPRYQYLREQVNPPSRFERYE